MFRRDRSRKGSVTAGGTKPGQRGSSVGSPVGKKLKNRGVVSLSPSTRSRPWFFRNSTMESTTCTDTAPGGSSSMAMMTMAVGMLDLTANTSGGDVELAEDIDRTNTYETDDDEDLQSFVTAPITPDRSGVHCPKESGSVHSELSMDDDPLLLTGKVQVTENDSKGASRDKPTDTERRDDTAVSKNDTASDRTDVVPEFVIINTSNCFPLEI